MTAGLVGSALAMPLLNLATDFTTAALTLVPMWVMFSMVGTPSLAYVADAASAAGSTCVWRTLRASGSRRGPPGCSTR